MKRFRFRLETLLALRKRREEEIKLELGRKTRELDGARRSLDRLHLSFIELQTTEKQRRATVTSAQELRLSAAWRFKLRQEILKQERLILGLDSDAAEIRNRLIRARQQHRAIEIIRERKYEAWKEEYNRAEQNFTDEVALRR